ncbi:TPA: restriction endonuclease subunit S [Escherichia coli]|nr:restriction endonuclease subunit S [Escherichia coli]
MNSGLILGRYYLERGDSSLRFYPDETTIRGDEDTEEYSGWQVSVTELADTDWDLTPRRRERNELLNALKPFTKASDPGYVDQLSTMSSIFAGRTIKAIDLTLAPHDVQAKGYIRISDLAHGRIVRVSRWLKPDVPYNSHVNLQPGDILISRSGTIGKNAVVSEAATGALAGHGLYVIRPDKNYLDSDYLLAYINSRACQNWFSAHARGTAIQNINRDTVLKLPIPVLPLPIQRRAVARYQQSGPFGAIVTHGENKNGSIVAENGQVYLTGLPQSGKLQVSWGKDKNSNCIVEYKLPEVSPGTLLNQQTAICR